MTPKKTQIIQISHPHVVCIEGICGGRPIIRNTRMPVSTLVHYYQSGLTIDEILDSFSFLTPAQVHDAFSYYYDNQKQIDKEIALSQDEEYWIAKYPPGKLSIKACSLLKQGPSEVQPSQREETYEAN
jgi:type III restriction enzyme